jgi:hypothetical protein
MPSRGKHPNSLANLKPRRPGDPPLPGAGRPRRPLTDPLEEMLSEIIPLTPKNKIMLASLELEAGKATYADAMRKAKAIRSIMDEGSFQDLRDAIEGRPTERMQISGMDNRDIQITVVHEQARPKE